MDEGWLGWTAGIIDGEGCICIWRRHKKYPNMYRVSMRVGNTNPLMLEKLKELWGGYVGINEVRSPIAKSKQIYRWEVNGSDCLVVLESLKTYLVVKKEQAENAIGLIKRMTALNGRTGPSRALTEDEVSIRNKFYEKGKMLNRKGI